MKKFINNYAEPVELSMEQPSVTLNLPDGEYRLTIADAATNATRWEIVDATVAGSVATLARGQEATASQEWPAGSVIYNALTAETLTSLSAGAEIEMQASETHLQYRNAGTEAWIDLVSIQDIANSLSNRLIPSGGLMGQSLVKTSGADFDTNWADRALPATEITVGYNSGDGYYGYESGQYGELSEHAFAELGGRAGHVKWSHNVGASLYVASLQVYMDEGEPPSDVRVIIGAAILEFANPYYGGYGIAIDAEIYDSLPKTGTHPIKFEII